MIIIQRALLAVTVFLIAACSAATERPATTAEALFSTPQSGFVNTDTADPFTGKYLCPAYIPGTSPAVSWRDCNVNDPNQNWGVYEFNQPSGSRVFATHQWIYLKSSGNPATQPHQTLCMQGNASSNPPVLDALPCDNHPSTGLCNGSCRLTNTCVPGTSCASFASAIVSDMQINVGNACPDTSALTSGNPFGAIPMTLAACDQGHASTHGGLVPFGFDTVIATDGAFQGLPLYSTWSGGLLGQPWQEFQEPASGTVADGRNQPAAGNQHFTFLLDPTSAFGGGLHFANGTNASAGCTQCGGTYQTLGSPFFGSNNNGNLFAGLGWVNGAIRLAGVGAVLTDSFGSCMSAGDSNSTGTPMVWRPCQASSLVHMNPVVR